MRNKHLFLTKGFTMIEIMVVIVIIGLLATILVPKVIDLPDRAKTEKAKIEIRSFSTALNLYKIDNGMYPTTEQGLKALIEKPTIEPIPSSWNSNGYLDMEDVPLDPWNTPYIYRSPGSKGKEFEIISYGSDKKEGGTGYATDLKN